MILKTCIMTNSTCYRRAGKSTKTGIVVHSTGCNNPYIKRYVQPLETDLNYKEIIDDIGVNKYSNDWNHKNRQAGVHAFIGKNAKGIVETYQVLPYEKDAWGVGRGLLMPAGTKYYLDAKLKQSAGKLKTPTKTTAVVGNPNATYFKDANGKKFYCPSSAGLSYNFSPNARIQFEICEDAQTDEKYFTAAMKEAAEYCAYLCKKYGWGVDKICSHYESYHAGYGCNHGDPDSWMKKFGKDMNWFRSQVAQLMLSASAPKRIEEGSKVRIKPGVTKYVNGKTMASWVPKATLYVRRLEQNKTVALVSTLKTLPIYTGRVKITDIELI